MNGHDPIPGREELWKAIQKVADEAAERGVLQLAIREAAEPGLSFRDLAHGSGPLAKELKKFPAAILQAADRAGLSQKFWSLLQNWDRAVASQKKARQILIDSEYAKVLPRRFQTPEIEALLQLDEQERNKAIEALRREPDAEEKIRKVLFGLLRFAEYRQHADALFDFLLDQGRKERDYPFLNSLSRVLKEQSELPQPNELGWLVVTYWTESYKEVIPPLCLFTDSAIRDYFELVNGTKMTTAAVSKALQRLELEAPGEALIIGVQREGDGFLFSFEPPKLSGKKKKP